MMAHHPLASSMPAAAAARGRTPTRAASRNQGAHTPLSASVGRIERDDSPSPAHDDQPRTSSGNGVQRRAMRSNELEEEDGDAWPSAPPSIAASVASSSWGGPAPPLPPLPPPEEQQETRIVVAMPAQHTPGGSVRRRASLTDSNSSICRLERALAAERERSARLAEERLALQRSAETAGRRGAAAHKHAHALQESAAQLQSRLDQQRRYSTALELLAGGSTAAPNSDPLVAARRRAAQLKEQLATAATERETMARQLAAAELAQEEQRAYITVLQRALDTRVHQLNEQLATVAATGGASATGSVSPVAAVAVAPPRISKRSLVEVAARSCRLELEAELREARRLQREAEQRASVAEAAVARAAASKTTASPDKRLRSPSAEARRQKQADAAGEERMQHAEQQLEAEWLRRASQLETEWQRRRAELESDHMRRERELAEKVAALDQQLQAQMQQSAAASDAAAAAGAPRSATAAASSESESADRITQLESALSDAREESDRLLDYIEESKTQTTQLEESLQRAEDALRQCEAQLQASEGECQMWQEQCRVLEQSIIDGSEEQARDGDKEQARRDGSNSEAERQAHQQQQEQSAKQIEQLQSRVSDLQVQLEQEQRRFTSELEQQRTQSSAHLQDLRVQTTLQREHISSVESRITAAETRATHAETRVSQMEERASRAEEQQRAMEQQMAILERERGEAVERERETSTALASSRMQLHLPDSDTHDAHGHDAIGILSPAGAHLSQLQQLAAQSPMHMHGGAQQGRFTPDEALSPPRAPRTRTNDGGHLSPSALESSSRAALPSRSSATIAHSATTAVMMPASSSPAAPSESLETQMARAHELGAMQARLAHVAAERIAHQEREEALHHELEGARSSIQALELQLSAAQSELTSLRSSHAALQHQQQVRASEFAASMQSVAQRAGEMETLQLQYNTIRAEYDKLVAERRKFDAEYRQLQQAFNERQQESLAAASAHATEVEQLRNEHQLARNELTLAHAASSSQSAAAFAAQRREWEETQRSLEAQVAELRDLDEIRALDYERQLTQAQSQLQATESDLAREREARALVESKVEQMRVQLSAASSERERDVVQLRRQWESLLHTEREAQQRLEDRLRLEAHSAQAASQRLQSMEETVSDLRAQLSTAQAQVQRGEEEQRRLSLSLNETEKRLQDAQAQLVAHQNGIVALETEWNEFRHDVDVEKQRLHSLVDASSKQLAQRELDLQKIQGELALTKQSSAHAQGDFNAQVQRLRDELAQRDAALQEQVSKLRAADKTASDLRRQMQQLQLELAAAVKKYGEAVATLREKDASILSLQSRLQSAHSSLDAELCKRATMDQGALTTTAASAAALPAASSVYGHVGRSMPAALGSSIHAPVRATWSPSVSVGAAHAGSIPAPLAVSSFAASRRAASTLAPSALPHAPASKVEERLRNIQTTFAKLKLADRPAPPSPAVSAAGSSSGVTRLADRQSLSNA